ncbi:hypothetical protein [Kocuria turfanensis]|uniref:hypothetical protein n=1 Tax=Kocuria turfanensis TaxID=388357 RepID=UPI0007889295|nr:hypothetical protein [Kocuria turfanensis]
MAYTPLYPDLPLKSILTPDHLAHIENGIVGVSTEARTYVDDVAVQIQAGQVTDAAFDSAVDRAAADGRLVVEGGGIAQDLTITEAQEGVYRIADGTGEILGLTEGKKLPAAAKTDLASDLTNTATVVGKALSDGYAPALVNGNVPARRGEFALSPLNYGAVGDGVTSDQAALTATLTAAAAGAVIDLGGRTYNVGSGLTIGKKITLRNGSLTAVDARVALLNAAGIRLENVRVSRSGTARSGSFDSAFTVNAEEAQLVAVVATTTVGDALHLANGTCNGTVVEGGSYSTSDPNEAYGIQLRSGGTHNYDIRISRARIRNTGYGTGIGLYNCSRCTVEHCDVRGIRRSPWFTVTGWTLVSGTTYRALDRTDTNSNAVYVNGAEYRKNSD